LFAQELPAAADRL